MLYYIVSSPHTILELLARVPEQGAPINLIDGAAFEPRKHLGAMRSAPSTAPPCKLFPSLAPKKKGASYLNLRSMYKNGFWALKVREELLEVCSCNIVASWAPRAPKVWPLGLQQYVNKWPCRLRCWLFSGPEELRNFMVPSS